MIQQRPIARVAEQVPPRQVPSSYPEAFARRMRGRSKRALGDAFGLRNFGVNLVRLSPGAASSLRHAHARQDEFVLVLDGEAVLVTDAGETVLSAGMCAGFPAGTGDAHHLLNRSDRDVTYVEIGDRSPGDAVTYPDDDLAATLGPDGKWTYTRKDGSPVA